MASLLDSGRVKIQQHQQERHAAETASNSKGTNDTMSPGGSLQTILNCGTYLMQWNTVLKSFFCLLKHAPLGKITIYKADVFLFLKWHTLCQPYQEQKTAKQYCRKKQNQLQKVAVGMVFGQFAFLRKDWKDIFFFCQRTLIKKCYSHAARTLSMWWSVCACVYTCICIYTAIYIYTYVHVHIMSYVKIKQLFDGCDSMEHLQAR